MRTFCTSAEYRETGGTRGESGLNVHNLTTLTMVKKQAAKASSSKTKTPSKSIVKATTSRAAHRSQTQQAPLSTAHELDSAHQQKLLNIFHSTFNSVLSSGSFNSILQEVKTALFNREFDKAFGSEEYLDAYAARWSPTRALCYASVLAGIEPYLTECTATTIISTSPTAAEQAEQVIVSDAGPQTSENDVHDAAKQDDSVAVPPTTNSSESMNTIRRLQVLAIGGAAAEAVAFGSFLGQQSQKHQEASHPPPPPLHGDITLLDIAPWTSVVEKLRIGLTTPPALSKYASAAAQAANTALVRSEQVQHVAFRQHDVLALSKDDLTSLLSLATTTSPELGKQPVLITLLFTLNELFTAGGIGKTTAFLLTLTSVLPSGSLLLVIDSPGSYSETTVGKEAKRYPMQWLLDRILLGTTKTTKTTTTKDAGGGGGNEDDGGAEWEKVESADSVWFRLGPELKYPIPLEDMRYQMHLYRRGGTE